MILASALALFFSFNAAFAVDTNTNKNDLHASVKIEQTAPAEQPAKEPSAQPATWAEYVSDLVETSESTWVRLLFVFLLGLLMSLTPCIYPMIPITVGILQQQGSQSIAYNFLLSLAYALGIATTFALLGLLAASTGQLFGALLTNPLFIIVIVALLIYLALSMFGYYDIYLPTVFAQAGPKRGNIFSVFVYGLISGTIASPCLSPGLLLVLTIVATLANYWLGFWMLFSFGLGLSIPLLLIGTFSGSLQYLPKAGSWMIEIKKIFGFMLLGMCLYFLQPLLPTYILYWLVAFFVMGSGVYYLYSVTPSDSKGLRVAKNVIGVSLLAFSVLLFTYAYQATYLEPAEEKVPAHWHTMYAPALQQAQAENKLLLLDFWSTACSVCKLIDKELLGDPSVRAELDNFVVVKLKTDSPNEERAAVIKQFGVVGVPLIFVVDPQSQQVRKKWAGELYGTPTDEFIAQLRQLRGAA